MRKQLFHFIIFAMTICLFPQFSFAKTGYVSDMLLLTFRQGPGTTYTVTKTLKSNTPVSILGEENGFLKVELQSKEVGWVDKKFIIFNLPKSLKITQLEKENKILQTKVLKLESSIGTLKGQILSGQSDYSEKINSLEISLEAALDEKAKMSDSLARTIEKYNTLIKQSKNIQNIINENKTLGKTSKILARDLEQVKGKNKDLFKTSMIKWFLAGAGVLLLGWIIGQSVSSKRRRSSSFLD